MRTLGIIRFDSYHILFNLGVSPISQFKSILFFDLDRVKSTPVVSPQNKDLLENREIMNFLSSNNCLVNDSKYNMLCFRDGILNRIFP